MTKKNLQNIKHEMTLICRKVIVDKETNLMSAMEIFTKIAGTLEISKNDIPKGGKKEQMINIPVDFQSVNIWSNLNVGKEHRYIILNKLVDPNGKNLSSLELETVIKDNIQHRSITNFKMIPFTVSGTYKLITSIKEEGKKKFLKVNELEIGLDFEVKYN